MTQSKVNEYYNFFYDYYLIIMKLVVLLEKPGCKSLLKFFASKRFDFFGIRSCAKKAKKTTTKKNSGFSEGFITVVRRSL